MPARPLAQCGGRRCGYDEGRVQSEKDQQEKRFMMSRYMFLRSYLPPREDKNKIVGRSARVS